MRLPGILTVIGLMVSPIAVLALLPPGQSTTSTTRLQSLAFSPDRIVNLSGTILGPNQVAVDNMSGTLRLLSFPGVPDAIGITGYYQRPDGTLLLAFDSAVTLPSIWGGRITVDNRDVAIFEGSGYSFFFKGAKAGVPRGVAISSLSLLNNADLLFSFNAAVSLPAAGGGTITALSSDLVRLGPNGFSIFSTALRLGCLKG